eukprot:Opistho-2@83482
MSSEDENVAPGSSDDLPRESTATSASEEWMDVLGNGLLKLKTIKPGNQEAERPVNGQTVTLHYIGRLQSDDSEVESTRSGNPLVFRLGEGETLTVFDLVVALMYPGEIALVRTGARYAYGSQGKPPLIPADAALEYEIELVDIGLQSAPKTMTVAQRLETADGKRRRGNEQFSRGDFESALSSYTRAVSFLDAIPDEPGAGDDAADEGYVFPLSDADMVAAHATDAGRQLLVHCLSNMTACQLRIGLHDAALKTSERVLSIDPMNVKSLYRKAQASRSLGELDVAHDALVAAAKIEPSNRDVRAELDVVRQERKKLREKERRVYGGMLKGLNYDDVSASPSAQPDSWQSVWRYLSSPAMWAIAIVVVGVIGALLARS